MKKVLISIFLVFLFNTTTSSCFSVPTQISFEKKEAMSEYYKQHYSLIEKHLKKADDSVYIYLRGSCFRNDPVIVEKTDTVRFIYQNYSYRSKVKIFPITKKMIHIKYKNHNFKVKTNSKYFYTNVCFYQDTLRLEYYDYPYVDIIK